jgi:hypothetical protein
LASAREVKMASNTVVVTLPPEAVSALRDVALKEYRSPQAQLAWLALEGLHRRGALTDSWKSAVCAAAEVVAATEHTPA